jgi:hypothetical protein
MMFSSSEVIDRVLGSECDERTIMEQITLQKNNHGSKTTGSIVVGDVDTKSCLGLVRNCGRYGKFR